MRPNPEKDKETRRRWYQKNKESVKSRTRKWGADNKERKSELVSAWQKKNPEKMRTYRSKWLSNNQHKQNSYAASYRARKLNQTPENANKIWIDLIYENCPEGHHVDHIVALANGGLHHEDNLQYLTASENCSKGDR